MIPIRQFNRHNMQPDYKKNYNEVLFAQVAPAYDRITRVLSFGRDQAWKAKLIQLLPAKDYQHCLDLACGTGDITFALAQKFQQAMVYGIDVSTQMLSLAHKKNDAARVHFSCQDMCQLMFDDESMDLVTGGYALRNAPSFEIALNECYRVLKPGGIAAFLDFSKPSSRVLQKGNYALLKMWGMLWGQVFHNNAAVYGYIAESLMQFPTRLQVHGACKRRGFTVLKTKRLFAGMLEIIVCQK